MPIDQLPIEILTLILELVCTQNLLQEYQYDIPANLKPKKPPTTLSSPVITYLPALAVSAVCVRWRILSLALPGLWAGLKLEIVETETASNGIMATLQLYLERSAKAPLSLDIFVGYTGEFDPGDVVHPPALDILLQHTSRWKTVRRISNGYLSKTPLFLPVLEDLIVEYVIGVEAPNLYNCFRTAPMLRALSIDESVYIEEGILSKLPQHQLTTLIMSDYVLAYPKLYRVVGTLHNLTTLELRISPCVEQPRDLFILLAQLRSFTVWLEGSYSDVDDLNDWLQIFTFPLLDKLIISHLKYEDGKLTWSARTFSDFLSRSSCTLTHLSIDGIDISDLDLIAALQLLASLIRFGFDDFYEKEKKMQMERDQEGYSLFGFYVKNPITSFFLSSLTIRNLDSNPGPVLVPKLQSLSIKLKGTSFDDASFVEMVLSRWLLDLSYTTPIGVTSLRSLVLRLFERTVDEDIYKPLFELDKIGMHWGREVKEEIDLRPLGNLERMGMRVVVTGKEYSDLG